MKYKMIIKINGKEWNKKGYYRWSDIGMYIISFAVIAVGIGIGIFAFYSQTIDIRQQEADIIYDKLINSIVKDNRLNSIVLDENFNIYKESNLNKQIINDGNFYFKIEFFKGEELVKVIEDGNRDFNVNCFLKGDKFPKCRNEEFNTDYGGLNYKIKILTASNQFGKGL